MTAAQDDTSHDLPADGKPPADLASRFRPAVAFGVRRGEVRVVAVDPASPDPAGLSRSSLPVLAVPSNRIDQPQDEPALVVVAAEGRDERIAVEVARLLDPARARVALLHVTWLPGFASAPIPEHGLDDPAASDLLMYEGAREALIDRAAELRAAGFVVSTHLRIARHPAEALVAQLEARTSTMLVLGLGRHGAGIGREVLRRSPLPILYVDARD